ncbi:MAG TPA: hypothetical protein VJ852_10355 [Gemmatimonadaceae bacterium]|nr:hypothetical protein [Gemmatimonadaceae bacterium]
MSTKRFAVLSIFLALGCKSPSATEQMDSVISWIGTAGLTGEAWLRHTTPDKYTRQTLELTNKSLIDISSGLFKSLPAGIDSASLDSALTRSNEHVGLMAKLVEQKNSPDFRTLLDSLYADEKLVKQFADSVEAKDKQ